MNKPLLFIHNNSGGGIMSKTKILCDVTNCKFHENHECCANTISVCCDNCIQPNSSHETACKSFVCKCHK